LKLIVLINDCFPNRQVVQYMLPNRKIVPVPMVTMSQSHPIGCVCEPLNLREFMALYKFYFD